MAINRTVADVLPPSARTCAAAVDIFDHRHRKIFKSSGDMIPSELLAQKVSCVRFDPDGFGCHVWLMDETERDPAPAGTLATYGVDDTFLRDSYN